MEAFLEIQQKHSNHFSLGLFGDTMQRIYGDGKIDLGQNLPSDWEKPAKKMNHRCPHRVIKLINKIRSSVDDQEQRPRSDKGEGFVRLFILSDSTTGKNEAERKIRERMADVSGDLGWSNETEVKTLTIEHHMVARRMGFLTMFEPLYREGSLKTGLLDGTLSGLRLFSQLVLPVVKAKKNNDEFSIAAILRKNSPLLTREIIKSRGKNQKHQIEIARKALEELMTLWENNSEPTFLDVLRCITKTNLFDIPDSLRPIALRDENEQEIAKRSGECNSPLLEEDFPNSVLDAWDKFLLTPFAQIDQYATYVNGQSQFETHQGVKGLEFPRVMIIIDDNEARGFLFNYDKLLGVKGKTKTDLENENLGKETGIDRTRRLFYVTCSRAEESLAIVVYSNEPDRIRNHGLSEGWFEDSEVDIIN